MNKHAHNGTAYNGWYITYVPRPHARTSPYYQRPGQPPSKAARAANARAAAAARATGARATGARATNLWTEAEHKKLEVGDNSVTLSLPLSSL